MIARLWSARATAANAAAYIDHFFQAVLPLVRRVQGYEGVTVLQSEDGGLIEIVVITRWQSLDAIREFAGEPIDQAVVTDRARELLEGLDDRVRHYRVAIDESRSS
jgi:heme-degrading monooxygenase HmoA